MDESLRREIEEAVARGMTPDEIETKILMEKASLRKDEEARAALWLYAALQPRKRLDR